MELYLKRQFLYLLYTEIRVCLKIVRTRIAPLTEVNISWLVIANILDKSL